MAKETIKAKLKINNIEQNHILYSCCNIQILLYIYFFDWSPDLFPLLQAMLIFCNTCSFSISLDMSTTHITWSKAGKMCYKNIYEFFKPAGFLATKHDILQNDSMLKYICPLIFVQDWSSVLNQKKKKKKKICYNNSFPESVTNDVVFELYHCMKRYSYYVFVAEKY